MAGLNFDDLAPAAPPAPAAPRPKGGALSFDDLLAPAAPAAPQAQEPTFTDELVDLIKGLPSAGAQLAYDTVTTPVQMLKMIGQNEEQSRSLMTDEQKASPWNQPGFLSGLFGLDDAAKTAREATFGAHKAGQQAIDENLYQPKYTPGKVAKEGLQWVGPTLAPTKVVRMMRGPEKVAKYVADIVSGGVAPWAASEGTEYVTGSPEAGQLAGLATGLGGGAVETARTPEAIARRDYSGNSPGDWNAAIAMQDWAKERGIDLTTAEAMAEVTNNPNHPALKTLQYAEASPTGAQHTGPYFARRPQQVDAALEAALADIGPRPQNPQTIGPDVSKAAEQVVRDTEKARSAATNPYYQAANTQTVDPASMDQVIADLDAEIKRDTTGNISGPLSQFRDELIASKGTPASPTAPATPDKPALDIENIDTARKAWRDKLNASPTAKDAIPNIVRGKVSPYLDRIDTLMEQASPDFVKGKEEHARVTKEQVMPTEAGPVGDFANAKTTQGVGGLLFPGVPTSAQTDALIEAITRIQGTGQSMLPAVRQELDQILSGESKATVTGERGRTGAKFAQRLAGSPQRQQLLDAVLPAAGVPGQAAKDFGDLLDVLKATGKRWSQGSPTAERMRIQADLSTTPATQLAEAGAGRSLVPILGDLFKEFALRTNTDRLARQALDEGRNVQARGQQAWDQLLPNVLKRTGLGALANYYTEGGQDQ